jgi:hypothetical protein
MNNIFATIHGDQETPEVSWKSWINPDDICIDQVNGKWHVQIKTQRYFDQDKDTREWHFEDIKEEVGDFDDLEQAFIAGEKSRQELMASWA